MATKRTQDRTTMLLVGAAVSAGVHAGLAPEHLGEWPPLGVAFVAAAATLSFGIAGLVLRPAVRWPALLLATVLATLALGYVLTRLAALPPLDPSREAVDLLGGSTSALEAAGAVVAIQLGRTRTHGRPRLAVTTGGTQ